MRTADLAVRLGLTRERTISLVEADLIHPERNQRELFADLWLFDSIEYERFWNRVSGENASPAQRHSPQGITFARCFPAARCIQVRFVKVVRGLIDGRLCPVGIDPRRKGFSGLLFDKTEAITFYERHVVDRRTFTLEQAARELGIDIEDVYDLVMRRILPGLRVTVDGQPTVRITAHSIELFRSRFMLGAEFERRLLEASGATIALLSRTGLQQVPGRGPKFDKIRVIPRSQLMVDLDHDARAERRESQGVSPDRLKVQRIRRRAGLTKRYSTSISRRNA
jgi:hypothetical protein